MSPAERFKHIYIHDSGITHLHIDLQKSICRVLLDEARVLKTPTQILDCEIIYQSAILEFIDVKQIKFPDGYCLNDAILYHEVSQSEFPNYNKFSLTMSGGWDNDTYMRTIEITAKDFSLSGNTVEFSRATG